MKRFKYILAGAFSTLLLTGCLNDFKELNTNPEQLGNTDPRNVFTGATENFNNNSRNHLTGKYNSVMIYMQYLVSTNGPSAGYYVDPSKPNSHPQAYSPAYGDYYNTFGLRLNNLIHVTIPAQKEADKYADVGAIAQILLNYKQWQTLDTYGAAPITEGLKGQSEDVLTPRYDLYQKSINGEPMYKVIDREVKEAVKVLQASNKDQYNLASNDFFYKGDISKWIKFGNTLRVKMAQRLEKADNDFYNQVINEVLTSSDNIINSQEESCIYHHPNDYNNNTDDIQNITSRYCASAAFINYLKAYEDPRLRILARRNGFGPDNNNTYNDEIFEMLEKHYPDYKEKYKQFTGRYVGMSANPKNSEKEFSKNIALSLKYNKEDGSEATFNIRMYSQVESRFYVKNGGINGNNNMPQQCIENVEYMIDQDKIDCFTPIITYPETCFMLAEIAFKKGNSVAGKDATAWFREGIKASIIQYRNWAKNMYVVTETAKKAPDYNPIKDEEIEQYLARPEFQKASMEKIVSQQWINLYMQPEEMWATWKRTGLPKFKENPEPADGVAYLEAIEQNTNQLQIPRRNILPVPNSLNLDNYNAALDALMKDKMYGNSTEQTQGRIWWDKN